MLSDDERVKFAHRVMLMRLSTLRTLLDYREILEPDARLILEGEVKARSREINKKRKDRPEKFYDPAPLGPNCDSEVPF